MCLLTGTERLGYFYIFERKWFVLCYMHWSEKLAWGYENKLKKNYCKLEYREK